MKLAFKLSVLSMSILTAMSAYAEGSLDIDKDLDISGDYKIEDVSGILTLNYADGSSAYGFYGIKSLDHTANLTGSNISFDVDSRGKRHNVQGTLHPLRSYGIYQQGGASTNPKLNIGSEDSVVKINAASDDFSSAVFVASNAELSINGKDLTISAESTGAEARAIHAGSGAVIDIGSASTENVRIVAAGDDESTGLLAMQGQINIQSKTVSIESNGIYGILAQNNSETVEAPENTAHIIINAERTEITNTASEGSGIMAFSNGYVEINGDLVVDATYAIDTRGHATTNINQKGGATVVLKGDILFETPGDKDNSGNVIDANVNINLEGEGSSWTGSLIKLYPTAHEGNSKYTDVSGFELSLADGAQWNATESNATAPEGGIIKPLAANQVTLDGGVIKASSASQTVDIENLTITQKGGVFSAPAAEGENGSLTSAQLSVENATAEEGSTMTVKYTGITSDQINAENQDDLNAFVAEGIEVKETAQEGDINGAWERETHADGTTSVTQAANTKLTDFSSVNAMSLVQWRNEINHLTKRLGDIRASEGTIGAWARVYGGESQWGGANEVEMDHTTIQVGGDYRINNHWIAGAAFSYTDSRADLANGDADGDSYSLAVYGTYTADGGSFLDLIGRYGYLKNDITAGNMALDTSSSAFSLSAEMGHTFRFINDAAYVEPQIEFTYGFIGGDDATASNSVRIEQDDFQSFVTRVGVRAGYDFPQKKGSVYGMFSYSYDWMGDADGTASKDGLRQALSQDLGGGWVTYGVGAQIMLGDSAYFYGELERTSGGDIDNPYQFSAGVRMTF